LNAESVRELLAQGNALGIETIANERTLKELANPGSCDGGSATLTGLVIGF
jgi:hypothetical protein